MKKQQTYKFIDGNFSSKDSREILQNVFASKIQFHEMKNFSSQERFGEDDKTAIKRIPQLKKNIEKILKMIKTAEKKGEQIEIKSEILIRIIESDKNV